MANEKDIKHWRRRLESLEAERKRGWEAHWRDLAFHFMPRRARFLDAGEKTNAGDRRNYLYDDMGILARRTLSAGMQTGLTSPARPWFSLTLRYEDLAKAEAVKYWLHATFEGLVSVFAQSNFYDQIHLLYDELGVFGTGVLLIEEDDRNVIRCRTLTVGEYCLDVNASGRVDTLYRRVRMSARQIMQAWPNSTPDRIRNMAENDNPEWLDVLHIVEPARGGAPGPQVAAQPESVGGAAGGRARRSANQDKRPWRSVYLMLQGSKDEVLEDSGYYEFPALCPRWNTTASDVYGSSPAMDALGDCLSLQSLAKDGLEALEKEVKPPLLALQGAGMTRVNLAPGAVNWASNLGLNQAPVVSPLLQVRANLAALDQYKAQIKQQIREVFFNDLFLMLANVNKQMTATEVAERNAEKMLMLGPVLDRLRSELFQPLIERVFGIMWRRGDVPPPPPEVVETGEGLQIEFVSILAQAQKAAGLAAVTNTVGFVGQMAQMAPEVLDKLNVDEAVEQVAGMNGVPPKLLRSDEEVMQIRQQRAEQMAQQQQMAQLSQMAGLAQQGAGAMKDSGLNPADMAKAQALQQEQPEGEANV
ncbi:hypothetical protein FACS189460_4770 [Deltaproteobacteria bacterium]|nr:hypothetical protein FACS189460_4770 [Deltaproteobacteria bacterium]